MSHLCLKLKSGVLSCEDRVTAHVKHASMSVWEMLTIEISTVLMRMVRRYSVNNENLYVLQAHALFVSPLSVLSCWLQLSVYFLLHVMNVSCLECIGLDEWILCLRTTCIFFFCKPKCSIMILEELPLLVCSLHTVLKQYCEILIIWIRQIKARFVNVSFIFIFYFLCYWFYK